MIMEKNKNSENRISLAIFVIIFIAILLVPGILTIVNAISKNADNARNTENRTLAAFPLLKTEDGKFNEKYFQELDDYVKDHIGLRSQMVAANTFINTKLFNNSPEEAIVLGNNGWLFYSETVKDYINTPTFSEKNAKNIAVTIKMMQDYVEEKNGHFIFTVAANKNTLYPDNMPWYYSPLDRDGNLELIENELRLLGVHYADLQDAFLDDYSKTNEILYQTTDSHWNYKGALLGYNTIMKGLGLEDKKFANLTFTEKYDWPSDLATMLYSDNAKADKQLYPDYEFSYTNTGHDKSVEALKIVTNNENGQHNALIFRDSFFNTLQIYFAESFENVIFSRAYPYNMNLYDEVDADILIFEIVERNILNLAKKAPLMEAPVIGQISEERFTSLTNEDSLFIMNEYGDILIPDFTFYEEEKNGYRHCYGTIESQLEDYADCIYYTDGVYVYKAFPIYEQELLEAEELKDNGYSLYIKL